MTDITLKLPVLYDLLVDNFETLKEELCGLIAQPHKIENTNKFASLLAELKNQDFIPPLLLQISLGNKGDTWLTDFMYAAIILLRESSEEDEFETPENLVVKLELWLLGSQGNLCWKSANLLKFLVSESAERIQLKKLEERGGFFLTYAECILGLMRYDGEKHIHLVREIAEDETRDIQLRELCQEILEKGY